MILAWCLLAASPPSGGIDRWLPCDPGLSVVYRQTVDGELRSTMRETVRGPGAEPRSCVIDREVRAKERVERSAWLREHLSDRITNAGWVDLPQAFRPPLLKAPIARGTRWHFNRTNYEIRDAAAKVTVAAGTFEGAVVVRETAGDGGTHQAERTYAPGVGLVLYVRGGERLEAIRVETSTRAKGR